MTAPENPEIVALDSCVAIDAMVGRGQGAVIADRVVEAARLGKLELVASTLLLVEARGQGLKDCAFDPKKEAEVLHLLMQPHWHYVELDRNVALKARQFAQQLKLNNHDAVHLASAVITGADVFMTSDKTDFPIDTEIEGVWIAEPYPPGGHDLMTDDDS